MWTEKSIQKALVKARGGIVPFTRYICIPNVCSTAAIVTGEADLIAISEAGFVKEFEIKISVADLKRDKKKVRHKFWDHPKNKVSELWYVMPVEVAEAVNIEDHIPEFAGLIVVSSNRYGITICKIIRKAKRRQGALKLAPDQIVRIARLGCMRVWS